MEKTKRKKDDSTRNQKRKRFENDSNQKENQKKNEMNQHRLKIKEKTVSKRFEKMARNRIEGKIKNECRIKRKTI